MKTLLINVLDQQKSSRNEEPVDFTTRGIQFHFHSPSEHTIDNREFDLELHIVHKLMYVQKNQEDLFKNWRYAVTTVFFDVPKNMNLINQK